MLRRLFVLVGIALLMTSAVACRDVSRFSSKGDRFEGDVVKGSFVRTGVGEDTRICMTLDTDHLQDGPGVITTSDGRFRATAMRPIPQIWHDPLSTFTFGEGRDQNLIYAASPNIGDAGTEEAQDIMVIVSLMQANHIEVRLMRGAPQTDAGAAPIGVATAVFAVFNLDRELGSTCGF